MRRIPVLLFVALALVGPARQAGSSPFPDEDASAIRAAVTASVTAVQDTAWTTWVGFYTDDALLLPPHEPAIQGREAMLRWARAFPPLTTFALTPVEVDGRGDLAYEYGRYHWVAAPPGVPAVPDSGKYIVIWRKQPDGKWKIARDIFNSDVPVAPPAPTQE